MGTSKLDVRGLGSRTLSKRFFQPVCKIPEPKKPIIKDSMIDPIFKKNTDFHFGRLSKSSAKRL